MKPKITLVIIHYNTPHFIKSCLDSIVTQSYENIETIFIDNNSGDHSWREIIKANYPTVKIVANEDNLGYAKAANQGIRMAKEGGAKYAVITNPDIIYSPQYFEKIVEKMIDRPDVAAITGKVYAYDFDRDKPTRIIDTVGLFAYKNRRFIDDGQGLIDEGQFSEECEVFGISGACPLYRMEALEDVKLLDEYLDEDFFMYKEDVDLSWRFQLYGWKCLFYPEALAYHGRGTGIHRRFFNKEVLENRKKLSKFQRHFSFKNQRLMQVKNDNAKSILRNIPRQLGIFLYITFKEPFLWRSYILYLRQLPRALKKRRLIRKNTKVQPQEMEKWFQEQSKYL